MKKFFFTQHGFTLIEVLIALVILAVAFSSILVATNANTKNFQYIQNKTAAHWVSMNVIASAQLRMLNNYSNNAQIKGTMSMLNKNWEWRLQAAPTNNASVIKLDVIVSDPNNNRTIIHRIGFTAAEPN